MIKFISERPPALISGCVIAGISASAAISESTVPDAHIAIENAAVLTKQDAARIYGDLMVRMRSGYAAAQLDIISNYQDWPRFNDAPYISATHGQRYVNSYANKMARDYATLTEGESLPAGSVLAKDSITVTDDDRIFPGALFVMEKLASGTHPQTADWRYVMVMPDGSLFGDTLGSRSQEMQYCHECHDAVASRDYTFFVPSEYRVTE
jgi:Cytochrome P460